MSNSLPEEIYATFAGPINNDASKRFFENFDTAINGGVKHMHLLLQSSGGIVGDGMAIHNYLKRLPLTITCYNGGAVTSIAVLVFLGAKIRKASAGATFMLHKTTFNVSTPTAAVGLQIKMDSALLDDRNTETIYRAYLKIPDDKWDLHSRGDLVMSAEDAEEYGLIHEISDFHPPEGVKIFNI